VLLKEAFIAQSAGKDILRFVHCFYVIQLHKWGHVEENGIGNEREMFNRS
jgi:hypothetical protein